MIASYVPRKCGIATFTHDISSAVAETVFGQPLRECTRVGVVAVNDLPEGYDYPREVVFEIGQHRKEDYRRAAEFLNYSKFEAVCVQHEYGIYGGNDGEYLLALLADLTKPVVSVLHTVLTEPTEGQRAVLMSLCRRSSVVIVMAQRACRILQDVYDVPEDKIQQMHHGVPDVPFGDTEPFKKRFGLENRPTILTFGLLGPSKGIELMLEALPPVVEREPDLAYIVLGATHPGVKRESGESYRLTLEKMAVEFGIAQNVQFHNRYVSLEDLCEYLRASDVYVTPYRSKAQIVSGTLAYAVACGNAVISTPYWYAEELIANDRGMLVPFGDAKKLCEALQKLVGDEDLRNRYRRRAYEFGRQMIWPSVARVFSGQIDRACREEARAASVPATLKKDKPARVRLSLPEVRLDHLDRMTDDTGLIQHATHAVPNRLHGYSIDDVTRGLVVVAMHHSLFREERILKHFHTYLSYILHARLENGRFHNFLSYDRRWLDSVGSDDCQGRVLWSLGFVVAHAPDDSSRQLCRQLFEQSIHSLDETNFVRPRAFAILGCYYYLARYPDSAQVQGVLRLFADDLVHCYKRCAAPGWPWCASSATYDNGRLPQAMILAGVKLNEPQYLDLGIKSLDWLLEVQTGDRGQISLIGNNGWLKRGGTKPQFDQQPLEIAALVAACKAAYRATGRDQYLAQMRRCFDWYLGSNDLGLPMVDFKSRGCYDGLLPTGVNSNQGAESLVSWLLSLLIMHEIQTGDETSAG